jgi:hypothetical protein
VTGALDPDALRPERDDLGADPGEDLLVAPARLLLDERGLVLVAEQDRRAVDELADHLAVAERQLLARVGDEPVAPAAALAGVPEHPLRVVGGDQDIGDAADAVGDRGQLDLPGLAHRTRVERGDLGHRRVVGADEARGVLGLRDVHRRAVHVVADQPGPVVDEVLADRTDQHRSQPEVAQPEADVRGAPASADLEVVDEERQGDLVELVHDQ